MNARLVAVLAAATPGLLGAAVGTTSLAGVIFATGAAGMVAALVAREAVGAPRPRGVRAALDLAAWWAGAGSLVVSVILSSPAPEIVATPTPGRRLVLAVAGCVAAASVLVALSQRSAARAPGV